LKGFDADLAVISGRRSNLERMEALIARYGETPEAWLPHFCHPPERLAPATTSGDLSCH
jgi:type IV secretory pathway VirB4 component